MVSLIDNVFEMIRLFTDVALNGVPVGSALLLLIGTILVAFSMLALGYLALGAFGDLIVPDTGSRAPPQQRQ